MPQPRLGRVEKDKLPDTFKSMWETARERTGDATFIEVMANAPDLMQWFFDEFYAGVFYNGNPRMRLDVRAKELLRITLSKQHGCRFCNRSNNVDALAAGITQEQIDNIHNPDGGLFDEKDRAVVRLGEEMMLQNMRGHLSEKLYDSLRKHYDDGQIVEMGFVAAVLTGMAKWIFTFDLVEREESCPIKPPDPA